MTTPQKVLVPLADGFEELEAVTVIDVLRRAGVEVIVADLGESGRSDIGAGEPLVRGAHDIELATNATLDEVDLSDVEAIVMPGGLPGATNLQADARVLDACRYMAERGRWIAAICAAPIVLAEAGLLADHEATSYPAFRDRLGGARVVEGERVVISGRVITSVGPGTALDFSLTLVAVLCGPDMAREMATAMIAPGFVERAGIGA